ncbi:MAG: DPP IV N-terminal domain-containing protein [Planctomycetes bacterium]|nr:DPP IV N-terminal domain-containing protein [Planctomycetota bacterium]
MKTTTFALALILFAAVAHAADPVPGKPLDTTFLKQYAETRGFMLGRPVKPKIASDNKTVLFLRADPKTPKLKLFEFNVASGETKELLSPETLLKGAEENLSPEEKARRERQRVSVGGFTDYHLDRDSNRVLLALGGKLYVFNRVTAKTLELKTGTGVIVDPKWSPDGKKIAYVRGFDVYVYDLATEKESAVTTDGTATKTHGLAEFVAQEEMSRFSGYWWSPDSKHIAYEEADHTSVETWYVADPLKPDQKPSEQFYPRPGKKNVSVKLGIIPVTGGETVWVDWDAKEFEYLAAVRWDDLGPLTLQVQDRKQQKLSLLLVDSKTGKTKQLLQEKDTAWVNLNQDVPKFNGALGGFAWMGADPEGNAEIQIREWTTGKQQSVLVPAKNNPDSVLSLYSSRFETYLVYTASPDPTVTHVMRHQTRSLNVNPESDKDEFLTTEPGIHSGAFGKFGGPYAITSTTLKQMPKSTVFTLQGVKAGELPSLAAEPNFTPDVSVLKVGKGEDGYYCAVVRPRNFDPKKKYPVIVDVYGGPKHRHVVQAMRNWLVPQWLADQGFIVVAIENRGTPNRSREWEKSVYLKFGTVPLEDQVKGLELLCEKFPELDKDRVGIVGWSFGGYMAANGVLRKPDVFKAAVAGAPVTDWEDYDTHYTERYMGLLPESKLMYDQASLIPLAKDLKRPLLLVHGTADDNVYYRHTLKLSDALFRAGKDFEALALPGVTHMYSADPTVMERLWSKSAGFFKTHLGEPK